MNIIGKGNTAEVMECGERKLCKLFYEGQPEEFVRLEKDATNSEMNIPVC